jgi:hypothetical protein
MIASYSNDKMSLEDVRMELEILRTEVDHLYEIIKNKQEDV